MKLSALLVFAASPEARNMSYSEETQRVAEFWETLKAHHQCVESNCRKQCPEFDILTSSDAFLQTCLTCLETNACPLADRDRNYIESMREFCANDCGEKPSTKCMICQIENCDNDSGQLAVLNKLTSYGKAIDATGEDEAFRRCAAHMCKEKCIDGHFINGRFDFEGYEIKCEDCINRNCKRAKYQKFPADT